MKQIDIKKRLTKNYCNGKLFGFKVRILVATAQTMVLLLDDAVATVLTFRWKGADSSGFRMQGETGGAQQLKAMARAA